MSISQGISSSPCTSLPNQSKAKERSFSWYYLCLNVGSFAGEGGMPILRQSVGFVITWLTVLGATVTSTVLYLAGSCLYVKKKPQEKLHCSCKSQGRQKVYIVIGSPCYKSSVVMLYSGTLLKRTPLKYRHLCIKGTLLVPTFIPEMRTPVYTTGHFFRSPRCPHCRKVSTVIQLQSVLHGLTSSLHTVHRVRN